MVEVNVGQDQESTIEVEAVDTSSEVEVNVGQDQESTIEVEAVDTSSEVEVNVGQDYESTIAEVQAEGTASWRQTVMRGHQRVKSM